MEVLFVEASKIPALYLEVQNGVPWNRRACSGGGAEVKACSTVCTFSLIPGSQGASIGSHSTWSLCETIDNKGNHRWIGLAVAIKAKDTGESEEGRAAVNLKQLGLVRWVE